MSSPHLVIRYLMCVRVRRCMLRSAVALPATCFRSVHSHRSLRYPRGRLLQRCLVRTRGVYGAIAGGRLSLRPQLWSEMVTLSNVPRDSGCTMRLLVYLYAMLFFSCTLSHRSCASVSSGVSRGGCVGRLCIRVSGGGDGCLCLLATVPPALARGCRGWLVVFFGGGLFITPRSAGGRGSSGGGISAAVGGISIVIQNMGLMKAFMVRLNRTATFPCVSAGTTT